MCPHTTIYVVLGAFDTWLLMRGMHSTLCVLIHYYMWPHTSTYVVLGAFDAWLLMRGMRTLFVRVERQCQVLRDAAMTVSAYAAVNVSLCAVRKGRAPVTGTRLDAAINVSAYYSMWPHTATYLASGYCYMCPHTTIYMSSFYHTAYYYVPSALIPVHLCPPRAYLRYVSSYHYIYVLELPHVCPMCPTSIQSSIYVRADTYTF